MGLHHVQIAAPPGSEDLIRRFYGALGFVEVGKPAVLAARGGCWFTLGDTHSAELHVGIEEPFVPSRKAHPAFNADVDAMALLVAIAGGEVVWADREEWAGSPHAGLRRFHTHDPVGNRLEMVGR